ncbi:hypothetical protein EGM85_11685, partial [Macrococcus caseolyticus]
GRAWHKECFKCGDCLKRLDSTNCCEGPDKDTVAFSIENELWYGGNEKSNIPVRLLVFGEC